VAGEVITWHASPDGLHVYASGKLVAVIPAEKFAALLADVANVLAKTAKR
jgi:hypothetical protein